MSGLERTRRALGLSRVESTAGAVAVGQAHLFSRPFGCECLNLLALAPTIRL